MRAVLPMWGPSAAGPVPRPGGPAADALRCPSWRITEELHAGRNHPHDEVSGSSKTSSQVITRSRAATAAVRQLSIVDGAPRHR